MIAQLYKVSIKDAALLYEENPHDIAGDMVFGDDDSNMLSGFVVGREQDDAIVLLFEPRDLPENIGASVIKEKCDFIEELRRLIFLNPVAFLKIKEVIANAEFDSNL